MAGRTAKDGSVYTLEKDEFGFTNIVRTKNGKSYSMRLSEYVPLEEIWAMYMKEDSHENWNGMWD